MTATNEPMDKTCQELLDAFFEKHPDDDLRDRVSQTLALLLDRDITLRGVPGGWAGGIVYATYVGRMLRLTSLAPDIIEAILRGDEPDGMSLEKLRKNMPVRWGEQRALWP